MAGKRTKKKSTLIKKIYYGRKKGKAIPIYGHKIVKRIGRHSFIVQWKTTKKNLPGKTYHGTFYNTRKEAQASGHHRRRKRRKRRKSRDRRRRHTNRRRRRGGEGPSIFHQLFGRTLSPERNRERKSLRKIALGLYSGDDDLTTKIKTTALTITQLKELINKKKIEKNLTAKQRQQIEVKKMEKLLATLAKRKDSNVKITKSIPTPTHNNQTSSLPYAERDRDQGPTEEESAKEETWRPRWAY